MKKTLFLGKLPELKEQRWGERSWQVREAFLGQNKLHLDPLNMKGVKKKIELKMTLVFGV